MDKEGLLQELFSSKGEEYGFDEVTAGFAPERGLKIVWMRSLGWIDFWVSDYLRDAPEEVLGSVADTIYSRICSQDRIPYSEAMVDYVTSERFLAMNRPLYLSRVNGISDGTKGRHSDLSESYRRLMKRGLVEDDPRIAIRWAPMTECGYAGHSSILMRSVCISRRLDSIFVSKEILDFVLCSQLCFVQEDFHEDPSANIIAAKEKLKKYPGYERMMKDVMGMGLRLWRDVSPAD